MNMKYRWIVAATVFAMACTTVQADPQRQCAKQWIAGLDYIELAPAERGNSGEHPQLLFRRYYTDAASRHFERELDRWLKTQAGQIKIAYAPGVASPVEFATARMDLTLDALDRNDLRGETYYAWVQNEKNRFTYRCGWHYLDKAGIDRFNQEFAQAHGIDEAMFRGVYGSYNLEYLLLKEAPKSGVDRMVVIDNRYATCLLRTACGAAGKADSADNFRRMLGLIEFLLKK